MSKEIDYSGKQFMSGGQPDSRIWTKEPIPKNSVAIMTLWFGRQMDDCSDYEAFKRESICFDGIHLADFHIPDAGRLNNAEAYRSVLPDLVRELDGIRDPLAVFIIATPQVAELGHIDHLHQGILSYRSFRKAEPTFVYKVIFGSGFSNRTYEDHDPFLEEEIRSRELGGVFVPFNGDYPSVAGRRLTEIMRRILGYDLPGEEFPNYTPEEVEKIAWNAKRESFNVFSHRIGAIPKYPIVNGKPVFPF